MTKKLSQKERWHIVEDLIQSLNALEEVNATYNPEKDIDDLIEEKKNLLDDLSPNWRNTRSSKDVEVNEIEVKN